MSVKKRSKSFAILVVFLLGGMQSCVSIKEYQKMYLNDMDMQLADDRIKTFESGFLTYREGASGANGGKSGGGCGCN